jgi:hypothetical protein
MDTLTPQELETPASAHRGKCCAIVALTLGLWHTLGLT